MSKKSGRRYLLSIVEYCFCIFSFLTIPSIQSLYFVEGTIRYFSIPSIISILFVLNRLLKIRLRFFPRTIFLILVLAVFTTISFIQDNNIRLNNFYSIYLTYKDNLRYFFLALTFLYYPLIFEFSFNKETKNKIFFKDFLAINTLIVPVLQIFSSVSELSSSGVLLTESQADAGLIYNNYLLVSDSVLFSSLLSLSIRKDLVSLFIHLLVVVLLFLNGSRVPFLIGIIWIPIYFLLTLINKSNYSFVNMSKVSLRLRLPKKILKGISVASLLFTLIVVFQYFGYLNFFFEKIYSIFNFENIFSSRIYLSLLERQSEDHSLQYRLYYFECFYTNHLSDIDKILFGGPSDLGCGDKVSYLHSTLSILVDNGIIAFSAYLIIIFTSIKYILMRIRIFHSVLIFEFLTVLSFLFLGFSSRAGVSLLLPAATFGLSSAFWVNYRSLIGFSLVNIKKSIGYTN